MPAVAGFSTGQRRSQVEAVYQGRSSMRMHDPAADMIAYNRVLARPRMHQQPVIDVSRTSTTTAVPSAAW